MLPHLTRYFYCESGLKDQCALVLSSSFGLGKAVAKELASERAKVMLFSPFEEELKNAKQEIIEDTKNDNIDYFCGDLTKPEDIKALVKTTCEKFGPIFALFNNAGGPPAGPLNSFDDQTWYNAFELTLLSYQRVVREVAPIMMENGGGRIVNSTSSSIKAVLDNLGLSNTMRAGVVGWSKTVSQELGKYNILVNVIGPGRIGTARIDYLDKMRADKQGITVKELQENTWKTIPLGRYGKPEEYGKLAAFLLSATANTYITGQTILLDGGLVKAL